LVRYGLLWEGGRSWRVTHNFIMGFLPLGVEVEAFERHLLDIVIATFGHT
jgi:hypothetical protein